MRGSRPDFRWSEPQAPAGPERAPVFAEAASGAAVIAFAGTASMSPVATWQATSAVPIGLSTGVTCEHFSIA